MDDFIANTLFHRHEATLEMADLYADAHYMLGILTRAREIAEHPNLAHEFWQGWGGLERQRLVELPAEACIGSPFRRFILREFGQPPPTPVP